MKDFHAVLKELRMERALSQQQLAEALGVNQRTISNWEVTAVEPDFSMLLKISNYFGVSTDYLLGKDTF